MQMITLTGQHDKPEESSVYSTVKMGSAAGTVGFKSPSNILFKIIKIDPVHNYRPAWFKSPQ